MVHLLRCWGSCSRRVSHLLRSQEEKAGSNQSLSHVVSKVGPGEVLTLTVHMSQDVLERRMPPQNNEIFVVSDNSLSRGETT